MMPGTYNAVGANSAAGAAAAASEELLQRSRMSQLWYKAVIAAEKDGCDCRCCYFTRQQSAVMMGEEADEGADDAAGARLPAKRRG
jgi:hypothetical protein